MIAIPGSDTALGAQHWVINDICQDDDGSGGGGGYSGGGPCLFSIWLYWESNGIEGLQRGDKVRQDETCGAEPDSIPY